MPRNTEKEVKDFIIRYAVESVLESSGCEVKHDRRIEDFVEYAKWVPFKFIEGTQSRVLDFRTMIVDYFESDDEHYFELIRKLKKLKDEAKDLESAPV